MCPRPAKSHPRAQGFRDGLSTLLCEHRNWLRGRRIGVLSHTAAVGTRGLTSAQRLHDSGIGNVTLLFGPEHGFSGQAGAGSRVRSRRHPFWNIPVVSLYGKRRTPSAAALRNCDVLLYDLQTVPTRAYTYLATLRNVLQAAARYGKELVVIDRPVPLPNTVDGPVTEPDFLSFVAPLRVPLAYGMTPGETALWIRDALRLDVDLRVSPMRGYRRDEERQDEWPAWIAPSPAMRTWETGIVYPSTVALEAMVALDLARGSAWAYHMLSASWLDAPAVSEAFNASPPPGVRLLPDFGCGARGTLQPAVRIAVRSPSRLRPARTLLALLSALAQVHGTERIWGRYTRASFFDALAGTSALRLSLRAGIPPGDVARGWRRDLLDFRRSRRRHLLYSRTDA